MTEYLYMPDADANYIREFTAVVKASGEGYVVLDRTAFYPLGGGQPTDKGVLIWDGREYPVVEVRKKSGQHVLADGGMVIPVGSEVSGRIDWERRYAHMRMHTAQHLVSGLVYDLYGARTVGNQIHADRSRIDFAPANFTDDDLRRIEDECNGIISRRPPIHIYEMDRSDLEARVEIERVNLDLIPSFIKRLRVVEIEGWDICPCAGTHVRNLGEVGRIEITKREKKGKDTTRINYILHPPDEGGSGE
ncbi:MAG: alanyl-tRNA editing protein [Thermoplasmata archaeon]|nr:alanyl-tRNA editing protein [Thermoplasmata archaeon]